LSYEEQSGAASEWDDPANEPERKYCGVTGEKYGQPSQRVLSRLELLSGGERSPDDPFVKADIPSLASRTSLSLGWPRLAALSQPMILGACHVHDEAGSPEALGGPALINRALTIRDSRACSL
jgi:hypothetical protein